MPLQKQADKETVCWQVYNMVIAYHKMHFLDMSLPRYLTGIHFEKEYTPYIRSLDHFSHKFRLWLARFESQKKSAEGFICYDGFSVYYYKHIIYHNCGETLFKPFAYCVKSVTFDL